MENVIASSILQKMVDVEKCNELEGDIIYFMAYLRLEFPQIRISPKLHMLEDHVIPFLQKWGASMESKVESQSTKPSIP